MLLEKRQFCVALCVNPTLQEDEFYDFLLAKVVGKSPSSQKSQQLMALEQTLLKNQAEKRPTILMIDEAHRLPLGLLEEIRLLLNLETPREKLLEIILAGQPELSDVFRRPDLRQLKQRVSYVCRLKALNSAELREYVRHRLNCAGCRNMLLFPEETLQAIFQHTNGIPRLVNTLCDNCLQIGFALQVPSITVSIVEEAAADLDLAQSDNRSKMVGASGKEPVAGGASSRAATPKPAGLVPTIRATPGEKGPPRSALLEGYATPQKRSNFLSGLMDRWR
jgi:type II secretory pathway predicted ATPase ExeA